MEQVLSIFRKKRSICEGEREKRLMKGGRKGRQKRQMGKDRHFLCFMIIWELL